MLPGYALGVPWHLRRSSSGASKRPCWGYAVLRGLDAEFVRFADICLVGCPAEEVENIKRMFMAGALAASNRILAILDADLPMNRKAALLRRVARECESFQKEFIKAAAET